MLVHSLSSTMKVSLEVPCANQLRNLQTTFKKLRNLGSQHWTKSCNHLQSSSYQEWKHPSQYLVWEHPLVTLAVSLPASGLWSTTLGLSLKGRTYSPMKWPDWLTSRNYESISCRKLQITTNNSGIITNRFSVNFVHVAQWKRRRTSMKLTDTSPSEDCGFDSHHGYC